MDVTVGVELSGVVGKYLHGISLKAEACSCSYNSKHEFKLWEVKNCVESWLHPLERKVVGCTGNRTWYVGIIF